MKNDRPSGDEKLGGFSGGSRLCDFSISFIFLFYLVIVTFLHIRLFFFSFFMHVKRRKKLKLQLILIILCDCKLIGNHVILICVCLFVVDVGWIELMQLFAQHASIHCRSHIFLHKFNMIIIVGLCLFVYCCFFHFVHPRGLLGCRK